ncbi:MAG: 1-deoxy-D-xylulose-5-phosphate reductoisomerase [Paludibacteraceae bacterium]|nr:1-deoxy-D-xylulose-5-phosphate reductoisomerase [Paludibacteraceae bacterium]
MKKISILGSTGSIGTQTLDVIRENKDKYEAFAITAGRNADLLVQQIREFEPNFAVIADESKYEFVSEAVKGLKTKVLAGERAICEVAEMSEVDMVLVALVGYSGLAPTISAIKAGKQIALANKETLVVAGDLVCDLCQKFGVKLLPVDSEHSAIFQCLDGNRHNRLEKIILTASGGPFRGWTRKQLENVTPAQALKHPNWSMGAKITIDSASMMNKGFEVIEAKWLFDLTPEMIEVQVHPQSIIHSMVQYEDGAVLAQLGTPDMRIPISLAMSYPNRIHLGGERLDFAKVATLTFEKPDPEVFRNLALAFRALDEKGNSACALNAANEVVVAKFLKNEIGFLEMSDVIERTMDEVRKSHFVQKPSYEDYVETDKTARRLAESFC